MNKLHEEIESWLVSYKKNSVKPSTYDRLLVSLELLKKHPIANIPLDFLESDDIQNYINDMVEQKYARSTVKKQFYLIGAFIEHANLKGAFVRPIHKGARLPSESSMKKRRREVIAYTAREQSLLNEVLMSKPDPVYRADRFMMETGLRVGEVAALEWSDVDWKRKAIKISKTVVRIVEHKMSYVQIGAKSSSSNRTIPLSPTAYDLLCVMYDEDGPEPEGYIFHDEEGGRISYASLRYRTEQACKKAGLPYYGLHVFRHTFATNCYNKGCDVKILSKFLGHSDVTITYNVYIHLFGDALEEMRSIFN